MHHQTFSTNRGPLNSGVLRSASKLDFLEPFSVSMPAYDTCSSTRRGNMRDLGLYGCDRIILLRCSGKDSKNLKRGFVNNLNI